MYKAVKCKDEFNVSIQASTRNYCDPRDNFGPYTTVELGFPSAADSLIMKYAEDSSNPTETVYGYVPVGIVKALLIKHGGVVQGELPPFHFNAEQALFLAEALQLLSDEDEANDK